MPAQPAEIVRTDDGGTAMVLRRHYSDPVEDVWAAITESDRLARWIGTWTGEPREGGTVSFTMTGEVDAAAFERAFAAVSRPEPIHDFGPDAGRQYS